jgi:hypothetical protein
MSPSRALRRRAAVGQRGPFSELGAHVAAESQASEASDDVPGQLVLGHTLAERGQRRLVRGERHVVRALHERDLRLRLEDAATGRDGRCVDDLHSRVAAYSIGDEEPYSPSIPIRLYRTPRSATIFAIAW